MSDSATKPSYVGPAVGDTINGRVVNATRGTINGGNFVSFDSGATYVPVSDIETAVEAAPAAEAAAAPVEAAPAAVGAAGPAESAPAP